MKLLKYIVGLYKPKKVEGDLLRSLSICSELWGALKGILALAPASR